MLLAIPEDEYRSASVSDGGADWIRKFNNLYGDRKAKEKLPVLQQEEELPSWLADPQGYNVWQRNNLWTMLFGLAGGSAIASVIALWNQEEGDGFGGTKSMVELANKRSVPIEILPAKDLL